MGTESVENMSSDDWQWASENRGKVWHRDRQTLELGVSCDAVGQLSQST